ncbi:MAG TPA: hypothetical protein VJM34_00715 [Novosphingobium sp.]|nr:hypothetical protein [Novosphingobium sp.]
MKRICRLIAAVALLTAVATPAFAGWKLVPKGVPALAAGGLKVTPSDDWNRSSSRPIKKSEVWTLDGATLNELYFVSGLVPGETLFKDANKKERPLPKLRASMDLTEIPEFFESSQRVALNTSVFEITGVEPYKFAGKPGVRFCFQYAVQGATLIREGEVAATLVGDKLYLISFIAPSIHYFDRDRPKAEAIMASAAL